MSFEKIIGNENAKQILINSLKNNNILHSYIFSGPEGVGKKQIAKEFAKNILCLENNNQACNSCKSCIEFSNNNNPDFSVISSEGKIKIEQIRKMQEKIYEKPIISTKKVYIIDNSDEMTIEAQNCLLKTLEEPPEYIVIILITANDSNLINTIKSRCIKIPFTKITDDELKRYLENIQEFENITESMIKMFDGSIGKALKIKEKYEIYSGLNRILENIEKENIINILNNSQEIYKNKEDIVQILEYFNIYFLEKTKEKKNNIRKYLNSIKIVEETKNRLFYNSNYDMSIDNMLLKIWEEFNN